MNDKYILFCGQNYYPRGGWDDFRGFFNTIEECKNSLMIEYDDWAHIVYKDKIILWGTYRFNSKWVFTEEE